jgi:gluconate 2-dehydrogenase gamma chain
MPRIISRRDLLRTAGAVGAAAAAADAPSAGAGSQQTTAAPAATAVRPREAYESLTAAEADMLEAFVARLIPTDEHGPGATEARAAHYIDRALAGALAGSLPAYRAGFAAFDRYCRSSRGKAFIDLSPAEQDAVLVAVESGEATRSGAGFSGSSTAFFAMVKAHTWQGTFGDPYYGGNANFVGWDLLRYPGVRTMVSETDQRQLERNELTPSHRSAYDFEGFNKATARADLQGDMKHGD